MSDTITRSALREAIKAASRPTPPPVRTFHDEVTGEEWATIGDREYVVVEDNEEDNHS